jgi:hypothetical protein
VTVRTITHFEKIGAVYIAIPKACNTSIKSKLIFLETGKTVEDPHAKALDIQTLTPGTLTSSVRRKNFIFTFVRNPWDRMVSLWSDKCGPGSDIDLTRWGIEQGMPFDRFVDQVCSFPDSWADIHFQSQISLLLHRKRLLPSFIGRFESLSRDWEIVMNAITLPDANANRELPKIKATQHGAYRDYYSQTLAMKIGARFASDASMLGYVF